MSERARRDPPDLVLRPLLGFAAGVVLLILAVAAGTDLLVPAPDRPGPQPQTGQGPDPQIDPPADLDALLARQRARRDRLGWADRAAGTARVPVGVAMEIIAREGLPRRRAADCPGPAQAVPRAPQFDCGEGAE